MLSHDWCRDADTLGSRCLIFYLLLRDCLAFPTGLVRVSSYAAGHERQAAPVEPLRLLLDVCVRVDAQGKQSFQKFDLLIVTTAKPPPQNSLVLYTRLCALRKLMFVSM